MLIKFGDKIIIFTNIIERNSDMHVNTNTRMRTCTDTHAHNDAFCTLHSLVSFVQWWLEPWWIVSSVVLPLFLKSYKKKNETVKYLETKVNNGVFVNGIQITLNCEHTYALKIEIT